MLSTSSTRTRKKVKHFIIASPEARKAREQKSTPSTQARQTCDRSRQARKHVYTSSTLARKHPKHVSTQARKQGKYTSTPSTRFSRLALTLLDFFKISTYGNKLAILY